MGQNDCVTSLLYPIVLNNVLQNAPIAILASIIKIKTLSSISIINIIIIIIIEAFICHCTPKIL